MSYLLIYVLLNFKKVILLEKNCLYPNLFNELVFKGLVKYFYILLLKLLFY